MLRDFAQHWRVGKTLRVVVYRKPVHHETKKNYQFDPFDSNDGYFEYSAVSTNLSLRTGALWEFMAGRRAEEKTFAELKGEWALDVVPTHHYGTNSACQQISALGYNLLRNFQLQTLTTQDRVNELTVYDRSKTQTSCPIEELLSD